MTKFRRASEITPEEYELQVKMWLESVAGELDSFSANHREVLSSADGEYEIDVVVRFKALGGVQFKTLVECKKHKNSIKRELVQALHQKQHSLGANKAILVSTSDFQNGAVEFAKAHGVALVRLLGGAALYIRGSKNNDAPIHRFPRRPIPMRAFCTLQRADLFRKASTATRIWRWSAFLRAGAPASHSRRTASPPLNSSVEAVGNPSWTS
jgi:restriction system protein